MSKKRRRERPAVNVQLVEIYEDLGNQDENIRLKAAHTLLTKFVSEGAATGEQLNGILGRLIRGLCSGRKAARLGFSVALTEFLTELFGTKGQPARGASVPGLADITQLSTILVDETKVSGNVSGQEERDHQFGRLFGAEAIIKSGIFFQANIDILLWTDFVGIIFDLAQRKPWLREEGGFVLFKVIEALQEKESFYVQVIIDRLHVHGLAKTPEGVAIWIAAKANFPNLEFPPDVWKHEDPLDRKEKSSLARILKEGAVIDTHLQEAESKTPQHGFWNTRIHFVWDVIITKLLHNVQTMSLKTKSKVTKSVSFEDFWKECVDTSLFAAASSDERKSWGFLLFQKVISNVPVSVFPSVFTQNCMRCLINQLGSSGRFLHRAADKTMKSLLARTASEPECRILTLQALLIGPFGDINFDKATKTKSVETLLSQISQSECRQVMALYDELILHPGDQDEKDAAFRRLTLADQLVSALRNQRISNSDGDINLAGGLIIRNILEILAKFAYFDLSVQGNTHHNKLDPPFSPSSRQLYRTRILSCLGHLLAKSENPAYYAYNLTKTIRDGENSQAYGKSLLEFDGTVADIITKAWDIVDKANIAAKKTSTEPTKANNLHSVTLLYSLTILQIYNEDPEAVNILEELNHIFEGQIPNQSPASGSAPLVEILLGFTSKPSQLFRRLAQQVFMSCASDIDEIGLTSMTKVLEAKENMGGQEQMFAQDDDDENDLDESSEGSDVEEVDISAANSATSESEVGDIDETEIPEEPDGELAAFNAKLAQALGTRPGHEDLQADDSSSSDEDMNDEQMEALDEHLEKVFRERKKLTSKKTEKKDAKETIVNFKCKVLELLEIYVKQQHANPLALTLLMPMVTLVRTTTAPPVTSKACNVIRELSKHCKGNRMPGVDDAGKLLDLLEEFHREASKEASNAHASACSQASLLIARIIVAHNRDLLPQVAKRYAATWEKTLWDSSFKVKASFFTDCQTWCATIRK